MIIAPFFVAVEGDRDLNNHLKREYCASNIFRIRYHNGLNSLHRFKNGGRTPEQSPLRQQPEGKELVIDFVDAKG